MTTKYKKITYNNNPELYMYIPDDNRGKIVATGSEEAVIRDGEAFVKAVAMEEAFLKEKRERIRQDEENAIIKGKSLPEFRTLFEALNNPDHYLRFIRYFNSKGVTQANTFIWIDVKKGRVKGAIDFLAALEHHGYFRRSLTENERRVILLHDFGLEAGKDHVKRRKKEDRPGTYLFKKYGIEIIPAHLYL